MDSFKFNFLSWGQFESSSLDKLFLGFSGNLIFAFIAPMLCGVISISLTHQLNFLVDWLTPRPTD